MDMKRSLSSISNETTPLKRSASADMDNNEVNIGKCIF